MSVRNISGYVDGEGCFMVSVAPPAHSVGGVGGETEPVGQPEC